MAAENAMRAGDLATAGMADGLTEQLIGWPFINSSLFDHLCQA